MRVIFRTVIFLFLMMLSAVSRADLSQERFLNPPREAGVSCWWWWLNGNVTKEAITKDLEAMHDKGFSGAMIFDAGGANQRGNNQVPAGPMFGSPEWTELYLHALKEAKRLDLKMGLSIQSGWNLGGPNVTPEFAAKQLTWSEIKIEGPVAYSQKLPGPKRRENYYQDICVLAFQEKSKKNPQLFDLKVSSQREDYPAERSVDDDLDSYWVSIGRHPGQGPTADKSEWLEFSFEKSVTVSGVNIQGRKGYGPKKCRIVCPENDQETKTFSLKDGSNQVMFNPISGMKIRVVIDDSYDPQFPDSPRNVQICNLVLLDENHRPLWSGISSQPISDLPLKASFKEMGMSAPDTRFLLNNKPIQPGDSIILPEEVINISDRMDSDGTLDWQVPAGRWTILRFGYTVTNAHVSTSSGNWKGMVLDYLSETAFDRYWMEVVDPLLKKAGPLAGTVLTHLETDSWECGGMNWSPNFHKDFKNYRGYDPIPYLPVIAGKIIKDRRSSNAFLADFRKTLGDCVSDNHYRVFAEHAARYNIGIQPESAGPHAGPLDGIKNYQHSDIVMSEFWVPSPHRPTPPHRFFVKQASSAAHIYGKQYVGAEAFTSIGPHWNDVLWQSQKPSMDHEFCSGLNMIFFHTFTCSPKEMGLPGQEYFAGTHINPQVTWWEYSDGFMDYINRIQSVVQRGKFVADVLYYYGDHVPNIAALKESDPAGVLPGYDYDVTSENILLELKVDDGKVVVPGGIQYRLLVLPDHKVLSLATLEKVDKLLQQGATVLGPKAERLVSLVGGESAQERFSELSEKLWTAKPGEKGERKIGKGRLIWGQNARQVLQADGIVPDFEVMDAAKDAVYDYIHYTIDGADVYFVCNQTEQSRSATCAFRVIGKQPELWDPLTGRVRTANAFQQSGGRTTIPLEFDPYGSMLVVFKDAILTTQNGSEKKNFPELKTVQDIQGPWQVSFDPEWGGPALVQFDTLTDWTQNSDPGVRYYSGKAVYKKTFDFPEYKKGQTLWLELNSVEDIGIAAITLNGKDLGTVWTKPFRVQITDSLKKKSNQLKITVINSWRNRLVGDRDKRQGDRYTKTNIKIRDDWGLLKSGLIGPVEIKSN